MPETEEEAASWVYTKDITSVKDIARELDVTTTGVHRWIERRSDTDFPMHIAYISSGGGQGTLIFDMSEVREWFEIWAATRRNWYARKHGQDRKDPRSS